MTHEHPTAQVLAEFADGLLTPAATAEIESHTATCAECQEVLAAVGAVAGQLRRLPAEVAMPADVAAWMSAAIEREADARTASVRHRDESVAGGPVAWFRRRLPQALAATSVVGLLVVFGSVLANGPSGGSDSGADTAGGGGQSFETSEAPLLDQDSPNALQAPVESMTRAQLRAEILRVWDEGAEFRADSACGQQLASEQGRELVGSTELGTGVLIVLEDSSADELIGWVVHTCADLSGSALRDPLPVPLPDR